MTWTKVCIRRFREDDIPNKVRWINDSENNQYLHYELPLEEEKTRAWFRNNCDRTDRYDAVIECDGMPVGVIGLLGIGGGQAEYYVTLGEKEYKGKGVAAEATRLLLKYAFDVLNLRKVFLFTEIENVSAQKMFERCGFIRMGIAEKSASNRGRLVDRYSYQITAADFYHVKNLRENCYVTPIQFLERNANQIYIKRDDLFPVSFGGNKARKALNFYEEIDKGDYTCVVTYGSSSSNHCRIISNLAAARNLPCYIIGPKEASKTTFNSRMMESFGAEITVVPVEQVSETIERKLRELNEAGETPYFIAGGGHGNLGTQAYVDCYDEIKKFEQQNEMVFDYIFLASGTGTTQAGLVCGKLIHEDDKTIIGISIARKNPRGRQVVLDSVGEYLKEKKGGYILSQVESATIFDDSCTGSGYGQHDEEVLQVIDNMMVRHGIPMDSTYTAKAYLGMNQYIERAGIRDKNILFIHTGGTPLFFDDILEG